MGDINRKALARVQGRTVSGITPGVTLTDYAPSVAMIMSGRMFNSSSVDETLGKFDPNVISLRQREQMRRDPMVALGLHYIRAPIVNAPWHIECDDKQVAAFVDHALRQIYGRLLMQILTSLDFGYAAVVKRFQLQQVDWTYEDETGREQDVWPDKNLQAVTWNDFVVLPARGAEPKFNKTTGDFDGIRHSYATTPNGNPVDVPRTHALWITNEREQSFGDWYGYPRTGYVYRYWWSYWFRWLLGDRHFETDADPPLVIGVPAGEMVPDPDDPGKEITAQELGLRIGQSLRDGSTVVLPSETYQNDATGQTSGTRKWTAEFLKGGENMQAFQDSFEYLDVMKLRGLLVPEQALIEGAKGTGSRNVASTYGAVFAESEAILMAEIDQIINDYMIPDLVEQNFSDAPPVRKVTTGFREEDMELPKQIITILTQQDPRSLSLDLRKLVKMAGLPQLSPDDEQQVQQFGPDEPVTGDNAPPDGAPPQTQGDQGQLGGAPATPGGPPAGGGTPGQVQITGFSQDDVVADDGTFPMTLHFEDDEIRARSAELAGIVDDYLESVYTAAADTLSMTRTEYDATLRLAWDPNPHPRWPGGAPGSHGGEFRKITIGSILQRIGQQVSGTVDMSFLARGSGTISRVTARRGASGAVLDIDVEKRDGKKGTIHVPDETVDIMAILDALRRIDGGSVKPQQIPGQRAIAAEDKRVAEAKGQARTMPTPPDGLQHPLSAEELGFIQDAYSHPELSLWPPPKSEKARRLFASFLDTQEMWTTDNSTRESPRYVAERKRLHEKIIKEFLSKATPGQTDPIAFFTAGAPGVGKTTSNGVTGGYEPPLDAVRIDPDLIRAKLPEFQALAPMKDKKGQIIREGDPYAAYGTHEEAADIAREIMRRAGLGRYNMVIDGTGNTGEADFGDKAMNIKKLGYRTQLALFDVDVLHAIARATRRAQDDGRYLSPDFIDDTRSKVAKSHLDWREREDAFDEWRMFSTGVKYNDPLPLIAQGGAGSFNILNELLYNDFLYHASGPLYPMRSDGGRVRRNRQEPK